MDFDKSSHTEEQSCSKQCYTVAVLPHAALSGNILPNRKLENPGGMDYSIIETLALKLNFSFNLLTPADQKWGVPDANGNYSGLMGMVQTSEADMAISTISISESRMRVASFSDPYYYDSAIFVSRAINPDTSGMLFFIQPFTWQVWCLVVGTILTQWLLTVVVSKLLLNAIPKNTGFKTLSLWLKQNLTRTIPIDFRLILGVFLLFANLVGCLYCSTLTSSTSVGSKSSLINTISDMVRAVIRDKYIVTTQKDSVFEDVIMSSKTDHMTVIQPMMRRNQYSTPEEIKQALWSILLEKRIFIFYESGLQSLVDNMNIHGMLHFSKEKLFSDRLAIAFSRNFKCIPQINHELRLLSETGLIPHWHYQMMRSYHYRMLIAGTRKSVQSFIVSYDLYKLFLTAGSSFVVALTWLVVELLSYKMQTPS